MIELLDGGTAFLWSLLKFLAVAGGLFLLVMFLYGATFWRKKYPSDIERRRDEKGDRRG